MKNVKTIYSILFCLLVFFTFGQANLVPNPSFETFTACPSGLENVEYTVNWYAPTNGSSDYFDTCGLVTFPPASPPQTTAPSNFMGFQRAFTGGGYMGMIVYEDSQSNFPYREYIQTQLSAPLVAGTKYFLSFYVSLADSSRFCADAMGAYVSATPIMLTGGEPAIYANFTVTPQVSSPAGQLLTDAVNWKKISGAFVAAGGEQYITIGNFKNNTNITRSRRLPSEPYFFGGQTAYYFVDEICLSTSPQACNVDPNVGIQNYGITGLLFYYSSESKKISIENNGLPYTVKIMDLFGSTVKTSSVDRSKDFLDVSDLLPGCYLIWISDGKASSIKKILVD